MASGSMISWGHKPRPNGGKRRPRPIAGVYPKFTAPVPRGDLPRPPPAVRRPGFFPVLVNGSYAIPPRSITGSAKVDLLNMEACKAYRVIALLMEVLQNMVLAGDGAVRSLELAIGALRTFAFKIRREVIGCGGLPAKEPLHFIGQGHHD